MLQIAWPYVFLCAPLPLLMMWLSPRAHGGAYLRVPFFHAMSSAFSRRSAQRWFATFLALLAWLALVSSATRPQWVGEPVSLPLTGRDLLIAVDISGSMETADMVIGSRTQSRLVAVKKVAGEFIERRKGDRLGLILFGKRAYLQTPLTFDRTTVGILLNEAQVGLAGKETAIGDAIGLAVKRLRDKPADSRVVILLTDGANTAGEINPLKAADLAAQEGLRVYTIGIGADEMTVRGLFGARRVNPSADLDEDALRAIADKTGGQYFRARDAQELSNIYQILDQLEPQAEEQEVYRPVVDLFYWPLALAGLLILLLALFRFMRRDNV